jgi:competence protein ComEC
MADLRDRVLPRILVETALDERGLFAPVPADRSPSGLSPQQGQLPVADAAETRLPARRPLSSPVLPSNLRIWLPSVFRLALATEWERGTAFLFAPVLLAAGALSYFAVGREPYLATVAASAAAVAALTFLARSRPVLHVALAALLCFALGVLFAKLETMRAGTKVMGGEISTRLTGRVTVIEHQANGRIRMTMDVLGTERPTLKYVPQRVRVSARAIPAGLKAGDVVTGAARLGPPSGPTRPGGYDFSFNSYFDGIGANGFFLTGPELAAASPMPASTQFFTTVENLRTDLANRIRGEIGGAEGEIAAALVAGVRAGIPEDVNEALRRTGLAHILSISGLHMALVAATIMTVLRFGFAFFPGFASRRPVKKYAACAALVALAVYLFISGSAVAAERSFIMIGVMLTAMLFDRAALTMRNLAISAIAIIVVSPHEVAGPSFQMSFAATAALIGAYAAWSQRRRVQSAAAPSGQGLALRLARRVGGYAVGLAATSLIAGTATAVFGAYHFQRVSPLSLGANLAAAPFVSVMVMPFAMFAMILMPFGLDGWAFAVMGKGLSAMIAVANWFSALSPIDSVGLVPLSAVIVLTVALVLATLPTTWLRIAALPLALAGLAIVSGRTLPDAVVSEDGRLVAIRTNDGALAVSRARPNAFTTEDWQKALMAGAVIKPESIVPPDGPRPFSTINDRFRCSGDVCVARTASGAIVAYTATVSNAAALCSIASLIVIDDATAKNPCASGMATVLTKRDLARRGAASISFDGGSPLPAASVTFAIDEPYRPWHRHRAFSREARGIAPYVRKKKPEQAIPAAGVSTTPEAPAANPAAVPSGEMPDQ